MGLRTHQNALENNRPTIAESLLSYLKYGGGGGLDAEEMKNSLDTGQYAPQTNEHYREALSIGISGIPSFIIGGYFFSGVQPYEFFKKVVEMGKRHLQLL